MLTLDFYNKTKEKISPQIFVSLLEPAFSAVVKDKTTTVKKDFNFEVTLVGNAMIQKLNKKYHHKDRTTDVISLTYFDKKMTDSFLGEIFICVPYAKTQAKKIGQSLKEELRFLFTHGLLHLFEYDHMKLDEEEHMKKLTYKILGRSGRGAGI